MTDKKIVIFGGTTEGRILTERLAESSLANKYELFVFVASDYGAEQISCKKANIHSGALSLSEIEEVVKTADIVADTTHPFAVNISKYLSESCKKFNVPLLRFTRRGLAKDDDFAYFYTSHEDIAKDLVKTEGNILLTTGTNNLNKYSEIDRNRLFVRVLPSVEAIKKCEDENILHKNIIAMQGPFSEDFNSAIIKECHIAHLVTKDGGKAGGFSEKINAAEKAGIKAYVVLNNEKIEDNFVFTADEAEKQIYKILELLK